MDEEKEDCVIDEIKQKIHEKIKEFNTTDITPSNLDALYKLVDIKKDLANIDYWEIKKEEIKNEIQRL